MEPTANTTKLENLVFEKTQSIKGFLKSVGATELRVVRNPHTNKIFFTTDIADVSGKASENYKENPAISRCVDETTGESFLMLHKQNTSNVEDTFTLD